METVKRKSWILAVLLVFVLTFVAMFGVVGCGGKKAKKTNKTFNCAGKTFVYDGWEATAELTEAEKLEISGLALGSYGSGQFVFEADGTFTTTGLISNWSGTWEIVDQTVVLSMADDTQVVLTIVGTRFYLVQPMTETMELHIFYKVG